MQHENLTFPEAVRSLARELRHRDPRDRLAASAACSRACSRANAAGAGALPRALAGEAGAGRARTTWPGAGSTRERLEPLRHRLRARPLGRASSSALRRAHIAADGRRARRPRCARARAAATTTCCAAASTFPIQDARGRVIAFGGRALGRGPGAEVPEHAREPGLPQARGVLRLARRARGDPPQRARDRRRGLLRPHRARARRASARRSPPAAPRSPRSTRERSRRRTRNVVLLFDGDEAGQRAMVRALEVLLPAGLRVRAAALPAGATIPTTLLRREGAEALRAARRRGAAALEVAIARAVARGLPRRPWERADAVARRGAAARARARRRSSAASSRAGSRSRSARTRADVAAAVRRRARRDEPRGRAGAAAPHRAREERHFATLLRVLIKHPGRARRASTSAACSISRRDADWRALVGGRARRRRADDAGLAARRARGRAAPPLRPSSRTSSPPTDARRRRAGAARRTRDTLAKLAPGAGSRSEQKRAHGAHRRAASSAPRSRSSARSSDALQPDGLSPDLHTPHVPAAP